MKIPKIIHQIWSEIYKPLPEYYAALGETWKRDYPDWEYILWNDKMMNDFIAEHYPRYVDRYNSFPYDVQRWDAIRYLILDKMGGMYVDSDYESIEPMNELIADKMCCFAVEPEKHRLLYKRPNAEVFTNAMMLNVPGHPFMRCIIDDIFGDKDLSNIPEAKAYRVLYTTGPGALMELYDRLTSEEKGSIYLIPAKYVTPFNSNQAQRLRLGDMSEELEQCLEEAYAVHYFFSDWVDDKKMTIILFN